MKRILDWNKYLEKALRGSLYNNSEYRIHEEQSGNAPDRPYIAPCKGSAVSEYPETHQCSHNIYCGINKTGDTHCRVVRLHDPIFLIKLKNTELGIYCRYYKRYYHYYKTASFDY